jgi:hypothetical protein
MFKSTITSKVFALTSSTGYCTSLFLQEMKHTRAIKFIKIDLLFIILIFDKCNFFD